MSKVRIPLIGCLGLALVSACAPSYDPPEQAMVLAKQARGEREIVTVSAYFFVGALSEIEGADCTISGPGVRARFTTPHKISLPVPPVGNGNFNVTCITPIGAAIREQSKVLQPLTEETRTSADKDRIYPKSLNINYK
jgi:hypothetical protein